MNADADATAGLAALEMDLLGKDVAFWIDQSDTWKRLANDERDVTDRLRALIESAPHADDCCYLEQDVVEPWGARISLHAHCTCWKSDAL